MSRSLLLGLDLGTSGVKALLLPGDMTPGSGPAAEATAAYPLSIPAHGWSEQDPADWWRGTCEVIREVLARGGVDANEVEAVALSGQMHGATLLDADSEVLRPAILWNDARSGAECDRITEQIGSDHLLRWVANPALAGFTAPKLLWVRAHEPAIYRRISSVLLPKDYINFRLTGVRATEPSDASGTLLFDVVHRCWSADMLDALQLPPSWLPDVHESTGVIGTVSAAAAAATGLRQGTPVVAGGADNACAATGMGVVSPGQVLVSLGTSGTIVAPTLEPRLDPRARLHTFCHAVPDTWYLMGVVLSAAGSLRWLREALGPELAARAASENLDVYDLLMAEAAAAPPGSDGLLFLPYLTGERTPHDDPDARGVFFGLSLRHHREHLVRSVVEGVTFALADCADLMRQQEVAVDAVRASGGGARSRLWRQILADVLDARVLLALADFGPAFGAAILAGVGVGAFPSITETTDRLVALTDEVAPEGAAAAEYRRYHALYDSLYPALRDRFGALAGVLSAR